jgi:putative ABC transport system ATP-binding protein
MNLNPFRRKRAVKQLGWQSSDDFVQMHQITKTFRTPTGDFDALRNINADFGAGEFVSVVGKSGSGKSTLVNMLTGIDRPTSGQVKIGDAYVHGLGESQMARWRGRNLGIVFQFYQLLPMLSLLENTVLPMDFGDMYAPVERESRAMALLDMVGLADMAHKMPAEVSGGQQQSAAIARALANDPPLIVADEPTGNLDSRAAERIFELFEELVRTGKTIIMVTHDNSLAERASRKMLLADGQVVNETVAHALPLLTHQQMLKATHHLLPQRFQPGETIIQQGEPNDTFYMIAKGYTQVSVNRPSGNEMPIAQLGPGQHFGEVELLRKRLGAVANIKAALHSAVETVALEGRVFSELMAEAQSTREQLWQVVQARLAQNADSYASRRGHRSAETQMA